MPRLFIIVLLTACGLACSCRQAELAPPGNPVTRAEVLAAAERYRTHRWQAARENRFHGIDPDGIRVDTPDVDFRPEGASPGYWVSGDWNVGIPYQWGGFSTPEDFDEGVAAGKFAGDIYTAEKRRKLDSAVSRHAVGVDCSGFISKCWSLPRSYSTRELPKLCDELASYDELLPGDILNTHNSHVLLFARWQDEGRKTIVAYETGSAPTWKVLRHPIEAAYLKGLGYKAYRYRGIRD